MFASSLRSRARRRGIVLVLVLGMLGLMALIGVTFATFAGQSLISSRNFQQGVARPQSEALMDYALAQLINDTNNPLSSIRGHSLLRDMYGNDSVYRGANPSINPSSEIAGGILSTVYTAGVMSTLHFTAMVARSASGSVQPTPFYNQLQYQTNIPTGGPYYGLDFTRWIVRFPGNGVPQTFEVLEDDFSGNVHLFTLASNMVNPTTDLFTGTITSGDSNAFIYSDPNLGAIVNLTASPGSVTKVFTTLGKEIYNPATTSTLSPGNANISSPFVLDGRYMRAFNGPGLTQSFGTVYPGNLAAFGNFRITGFDPDTIGMDEDYDACDLENWFLAIQSADGQVMIPSFHRPGILMPTDWTTGVALAAAKILRPRQADNSPLFPPDPSTPDPITGKLTYDVDNDGDGVTDSVWLDLGYPVQRDPGGKLFKPLFAFMVLGLNGRLPLNTVGNLQARAIGNKTNTSGGGQGAGASSLQTNGNADATTQVPYPGPYGSPAATPDSTYFNSLLSSQVYLDAPLWDHTSHLGYSVNEINPKFALQNAPSNVYPVTGMTVGDPFGVYPSYSGTQATSAYSQYDNVGVSVALTQLRNILAGTVPTNVQNNLTAANLTSGAYNSTAQLNNDLNVVVVNSQPFILPNNVADVGDYVTGNAVARQYPAVAGRWGEPQGIPQILPSVVNDPLFFGNTAGMPPGPIVYPTMWFNNPVRAGRSFFNAGTNDAMDDDFDALDPFLGTVAETGSQFSLIASAAGASATQYQIPLNYTTAYTGSATFSRGFPEFVDSFDGAGQRAVASERIRSFTTPIDPAGVGRVVDFMNRPNNDRDYGNGYDKKGRTSFFRYFRPAGMPQEIRYPYSNANANFSNPNFQTNSGLGQQYLMPVLLPAGQSNNKLYGAQTTATPYSKSDVHINHYHGYQSALTPTTAGTSAQVLASMAPMPFDWDTNANMGSGGTPNGYGLTYDPNNSYNSTTGINLLAPMMAPINAAGTPVLNSTVNTNAGPNLVNAPANYVIGYAAVAPVVNGLPNSPFVHPNSGIYRGVSSLNLDEADEMNLYNSSRLDQPYGPSDLEWLYRLQDVDGATLTSRLSQLAPVSFLNPADGLTRRRMFSTDSWELNTFAYANDNPGGQFYYNSRFLPNASPSLETMNQVASQSATPYTPNQPPIPNLPFTPNFGFANPVTTEFLPNPTLPPTSANNNIANFLPNSASSAIGLPLALTPHSMSTLFTNAFSTAIATSTQANGVIIPSGAASTLQVQTPSLAHRDKKINLNMPLPIANDPAEPIRQKWCRETYQLLKAILPPASVDTPEELAALSQFVVNIIDFRDTDCTMTRFVNTDLEVTDVLTKSVNNVQTDPLDLTWTVSPAGVRFATTAIPAGHFPYDPSLYSPDAVTPYLVQHGMEYNPISLNEVMGYQAQYGTNPNPPTTYQAMFIELVNTLTEEMNNPGTTSNASAISLAGWDIILTPDTAGWGRPDPIAGDVSQVALPPQTPNPMGDPTMPPAATQKANSGTMDPNLQALQAAVQQFSIGGGATIKGINSNTVDYFIIGDYRAAGASVGNPTTIEGTNPVAKSTDINVRLPLSFVIPTPPSSSGQYYWVYLRRPANPFDTATPNQVRPNKEMVVVDAMRFPVIDAGPAKVTPGNPAVVTAVSPNVIYSAERLQPNRGGHLVRVDTPQPPSGNFAVPTMGAASGVTTICPPSPAYAYGYSEQMAAPPTGNGTGMYSSSTTSGNPPTTTTTYLATSKTIQQSINDPNKGSTGADTNWCHQPFLDRDFSSVAELLLVPGCPPGLFTKQFVEEQYPGNIFANTGKTTTATGTDYRNFIVSPATSISAPVGTTNPSLVGRKDFNTTTLPPEPAFPYLSDNFYYSAASVAPPSPGSSLDANYTQLTTEIGGWTGAGWHKMLEFFEVPSSANGAIGTADGGNNYDWARNDLKPGLLNLNLIIDEEVFAGLVDDPRLNDILACLSSAVPAVVTQIDGNGYPIHNTTTGYIFGQQSIYNQNSTNMTAGGTPFNVPAGRGYTARDPNVANYNPMAAPTYPFQQVHGIRAAFCDFLKLRHGGSGYLFAFGNGPAGSGDYPISSTLIYPIALNGQTNPQFPALPVPLVNPTRPVAAERPYRSLSYPDINYTVMRPASLPPSLDVTGSTTPVYTTRQTFPPIPVGGLTVALSGSTLTAGLQNLLQYNYVTGPPYVQLQPALAPMNQASTTPTAGIPFQYVFDPGLKNPYLPIQFVNTTSPLNTPTGSLPLAPPYATVPVASPATPPSAPFPPSIPPIPTRRLFQVPDHHRSTAGYSSNASISGQVDTADQTAVLAAIAAGNSPTDAQLAIQYTINQPTIPQQLSTGIGAGTQTPPSLIAPEQAAFLPDNYTPQANTTIRNLLGAGSASGATNDFRQHPLYRTEWLQKVMNLTTVRTHQFAVWITVGFFEVVKPGTPELGVPDVIGQELGLTSGTNTRYRSFFAIDRTKATGFNPYYPGNFRDCVTYRRRIE